MKNTVHVNFADRDHASRAVAALMDRGVSHDDISVFVKDADATWQKNYVEGEKAVDDMAGKGITVTTPADAAKGAAKGAGIGLGVGAIAALASLALPGVGLILAGPAVITAISGAVATAAAGGAAGAVYGYLKDQGMDENNAREVLNWVESGQVVVLVSTPSNNIDADEVNRILMKYAHEQELDSNDHQAVVEQREPVTNTRPS